MFDTCRAKFDYKRLDHVACAEVCACVVFFHVHMIYYCIILEELFEMLNAWPNFVFFYRFEHLRLITVHSVLHGRQALLHHSQFKISTR